MICENIACFNIMNIYFNLLSEKKYRNSEVLKKKTSLYGVVKTEIHKNGSKLIVCHSRNYTHSI